MTNITQAKMNKVRTSITINQIVLNRFRNYCESKGMKMSSIIEILVKQYLISVGYEKKEGGDVE